MHTLRLQRYFDEYTKAHWVDYVDLYATQLLREGHLLSEWETLHSKSRVNFSQWLACKHFEVCDVEECLVVQYLRFPARAIPTGRFFSDQPALLPISQASSTDRCHRATDTELPSKARLSKSNRTSSVICHEERGLARTTVIRDIAPPLRQFLREYCK